MTNDGDTRNGRSGKSVEGPEAWLEQLPAPAAILDSHGTPRVWNSDAAELLRYNGGSVALHLRGCNTSWFRSLTKDLPRTGRGRVIISRRRGAQHIALELRVRPLPGGDLLVMLRDCTNQLNRRRTHGDERQLRHFLDRLPEPLFIEQSGVVVYANDAAAAIVGAASPDDIRGTPLSRYLPADAQQRIARMLNSGTAADADPIETTILRAGATATTVQVSALPIQYGRKPALQLLLRDITAHRQAEAGLRATHERLRLISDMVRDHAILTLDAHTRIVSWNASAERVTGYPADDVIRAPLAILHSGSADALDDAFATARSNGKCELESAIRRQDGSVIRSLIAITTLLDPERAVIGYAVVLRDLSERLRAEESLRRSEDQLRHAQKMDAVGRLAAGIAHDFNNVLTAIQGHVAFLLDDLPADYGSRDDAVEIKRAADRATELTRQLLTFARRQPTKPVAVDVNGIINGAEKLLRRLIRADITLETDLQPVPPIFADPGQLEQVIVNLVVNARDAIRDQGTITIRTSCIEMDETFTARGLNLEPGQYVQMTVGDTGSGMSQHVQRQAFEPFFTTKTEGTGLGLSTVYGIVKQGGGHISCYSEEGVGTTFKIFLPVQPSNNHEPRLREQAAPVQSMGTVLLVEDDNAVRSLASRTLQASGYAVVEANDGEQALAIAGELTNIDVIVTDLMLPKMTGEDLASNVVVLHPHVGVVLMSGFSETSLVRNGRMKQRSHFLEKPFTPIALINSVINAMAG